MRRWWFSLSLFISACSMAAPSPTLDVTGSPSATATIAPTPPPAASATLPTDEPEVAALSRFVDSLPSFAGEAKLSIDVENPPVLAFRAERSDPSGAIDYAEILRFPSAKSAADAFGEAEVQFRGYPANRGQLSSIDSASDPPGDTKWIEWINGTHIYRIQTSNLSPEVGEAQDPTHLAEALFDAALESGLIAEPTPTPLPPSEPSPPPAGEAMAVPDPADYQWTLVAGGLRQPLDLTHAGDERLFVVEQAGMIQLLVEGQIRPTPFLDIRDRVNNDGSERGLLGLAFHPNYAENGFFFVNYTGSGGDTFVSRFSVSSDPDVADPDSETMLLNIEQPYRNHNGGGLKFGPDGMLYIGVGDGGSGNDPLGNGQSLDTLLGKILRLDVDGGEPYAIPPDNPFAQGGGRPEIWDFGLRNPWRFSFDRKTGALYIGDVGQGQWEEINFEPADSPGGVNYGWNILEGTHPLAGGPTEGLTGPVAEYSHQFGCSVTGGVVVRSPSLPAWNGVYIYGDFCAGTIWGLLQKADHTWEEQVLYQTQARISSFGEDLSGDVYLVDLNGNIHRLEPAS